MVTMKILPLSPDGKAGSENRWVRAQTEERDQRCAESTRTPHGQCCFFSSHCPHGLLDRAARKCRPAGCSQKKAALVPSMLALARDLILI